MRKFLIGVAGIAFLATGAMADPGKGHGGKPEGGGRDTGRSQASAHVESHGPGHSEARGKVQVRTPAARDDRARDDGRRWSAPERRDVRREAGDDRRDDRRDDRVEGRGDRDDREGRVVVRDVRFIDRDDFVRSRSFLRDDNRRVLIAGCPPGLAKKHNGCLPPGLAKRDERNYFRYDWQPRLFGLPHYERARYLYRDGYLLRLGAGDLVSGYIPLLGGALAVGNPWPTTYRSLTLPQYYVDYYDLGPANAYRYADNVIYRVDPKAAAITSVAALLTGDDITIGRPMPLGYDVYNVPTAYRDRYYDTPDAWYRYSDGYVYRIDPTTQLVAAAINLLV